MLLITKKKRFLGNPSPKSMVMVVPAWIFSAVLADGYFIEKEGTHRDQN